MTLPPVIDYGTPGSLDAFQRICRHSGCGDQMVIAGKEFTHLADPHTTVGPLILWPINRALRVDFRLYR
jgi:hypothetical protein